MPLQIHIGRWHRITTPWSRQIHPDRAGRPDNQFITRIFTEDRFHELDVANQQVIRHKGLDGPGKTAAMDAACPRQMVLMAGFTNCMVS